MAESLNDIINKLKSGAYTPTTPVDRRGHQSAAYTVASYLYYDAGLAPAVALPRLQLSDPEICQAISNEYAAITQKWDNVAALEKRFGADRDVNH
jgi:hypothetical protein